MQAALHACLWSEQSELSASPSSRHLWRMLCAGTSMYCLMCVAMFMQCPRLTMTWVMGGGCGDSRQSERRPCPMCSRQWICLAMDWYWVGPTDCRKHIQ